jgi:hypothetical protein
MNGRTMILAAALGLFSGCGGGSDLAVLVTLESHLETVEQVDLLVFGSEATCAGLTAEPASSATAPACQPGQPESGCTVSRLRIDDLDATAPVLFVSEGRRWVLGLGYDGSGALQGSGCAGPVEIEAGQTTRMTLRLR